MKDQLHHVADTRFGDIHHFGDMLRFFRSTYGQRMLRQHHNLPSSMKGARMSASALVDTLNELHYDISISTYNEIEKGKMLPGRSEAIPRSDAFLEALYTALGIEDEQDRSSLLQMLAFDIVRKRVGWNIAHHTITVPSPIGGNVVLLREE